MQKRHFFKDALVVTQPSRHRRWEIGRNFPSDFPPFLLYTHKANVSLKKEVWDSPPFLFPLRTHSRSPDTGWKSIWPEPPREYCSWASGRDRAGGKEGHHHTKRGLCCQTTQPGGVERFLIRVAEVRIRAKNHSYVVKKICKLFIFVRNITKAKKPTFF